MKQFFLGILATVVGGFSLFWLTNWYSINSNEESYEVDYSVSVAAGFIGTPEIEAFTRIIDAFPDASGKIAVVEIINRSDQTIRNAKFILSPTEASFDDNNLHGVGLASYSNGGMPEPKFETTPEGILVTFPIMEAQDGARIWIAHEPPQGIEVFSENDELILHDAGLDDIDQDDDIFGMFLFVLIVGLVTFVLGAIASEKMNKEILKKAGLDPDELQSRYYAALAAEKATSAATSKGKAPDDD